MRFVLIAFASISAAIIGFAKANMIKSQVKELERFIQALRSLKLEISYSSSPLFVIIEKIAKMHNNEFWNEFNECILSGDRASKAYTQCKDKLGFSLNQIETTLYMLFNNLGQSDIDSQCTLISNTIDSLESVKADITKESASKSKMCSSLGVAGALVIFIVLI